MKLKVSSCPKGTSIVIDPKAVYIFKINCPLDGDVIVTSQLDTIYEFYHRLRSKRYSISILFYITSYEWVNISEIDANGTNNASIDGVYMFMNSLAYRQYKIDSRYSIRVLNPQSGIDTIDIKFTRLSWLISMMVMNKHRFKIVTKNLGIRGELRQLVPISSALWHHSFIDKLLTVEDIYVENKDSIRYNLNDLVEEYSTNIEEYVKDFDDYKCIYLYKIISSNCMLNKVLSDDLVKSIKEFPVDHSYIAQLLGKDLDLSQIDHVVRYRQLKKSNLDTERKAMRVVFDRTMNNGFDGLLIVSNGFILRLNDVKG